ncbi:MAG: dihydrodipicolinate synthase family protein [Gammaproteobacteria bacterium]|nr:dihydrodipicolinate synthase family protein [Gammaproteobacteria bacterium]
MTNSVFSGVFPIAPVPFNENETLDLDGARRVLDCMIDQGVDGICVLANYSEQFLLSDDERDIILKLSLEHIAGRVPVIATCSHYSTAIVVQRIQRAKELGAAMIMLMPPYHGALLRGSEQHTYEQFSRAADVGLPIMVQDAPLSGVSLSVASLANMAKSIPGVSYLKIETAGTADKLAAVITQAGEHIDGPFDGEESITLLADLDAGATGTMPSASIPDLIKPVVSNYLAGDRQTAKDQYDLILPFINFENRQCGLRACKTLMREGGVIKSDYVRHPLDALPERTKIGLLEIAQALNPVVLEWGA